MSYVYIVLAAVVSIIATVGFLVHLSIQRDEKRKEKNKRVILYNRRTRKLKEILASDLVETKSWERIAVVNSSSLDSFLQYLKDEGIIGNNNKYLGKPIHATYYLRKAFMKFTER